jgi:hypothetical protein
VGVRDAKDGAGQRGVLRPSPEDMRLMRWGQTMDLVSKLDAIEGIKLAKARYFRAVDSKDVKLLRSVFTDDVMCDYRGATTDPITGYNMAPDTTEAPMQGGDHAAEAIIQAMKEMRSVHHASVPEIAITGPTCGNAIWPMVDRLLFVEGAPFKELIGYGHYYESYEREGDDWKISSIRLVRSRLDFIPW